MTCSNRNVCHLKKCRDPTVCRERHTVLLQELEMLVEPVLQYRHCGVYDAHRYDSFNGPSLSSFRLRAWLTVER